MEKIKKTNNSVFYNFNHTKTLLFICGGPEGNSALFYGYFFKNSLFENFNLLQIDIPGSGFSLDKKKLASFDEMVSFYIEEIQKQNVYNIVLIAESVGSVVACMMMSRSRDFFSSLVLLAPLLDVAQTKINALTRMKRVNEDLKSYLETILNMPEKLSSYPVSKEIQNFFNIPLEMKRVRTLSNRRFNTTSKILPDLNDESLHLYMSEIYEELFLLKKIGRSFEIIPFILKKLISDMNLIEEYLKNPESLDFKRFRTFLDYYNLFFDKLDTITYRHVCRTQCLEEESSSYSEDSIKCFDGNLIDNLEENNNLSMFSIESLFEDLVDYPSEKMIVLLGGQDTLITDHIKIQMKIFFKESQFINIEDVGHSIMFEAPEKVIEILNTHV